MNEPVESRERQPSSVNGQCRKIGHRLASYCSAMRQALEHQSEEGKGLSAQLGFVDGAPEVWLLGVVYRPKARVQGLLLNVCPWCAESLKWWPDSRPAPPVDQPPVA